MKSRGFVIRNFRNIGLCEGKKSQEAFLRLAKVGEKFGGLMILLGENNSGKSNLLIALKKFSDSYVSLNNPENTESLELLSQDDVSTLQSNLTSVALVHQEPAYYFQYSQDIAQKSGAAQKKRQMRKPFDLKNHIKELQKDFDNLNVYRERNERETIGIIKLLLKDSSSNDGRFMRCTIEPLKNIDDYSVDELNALNSIELNCSFVVGYEELDVQQNFADYINDTMQPITSSIMKEYGHIICFDKNGKPHQKYYTVHMKNEGNENTILYRHFQKLPNKKHKQLCTPHIIFYTETQFCDNDLCTTPDKLKESKLFRSGVSKKLLQITQDFNALFGVEDDKEKYRFELNIDIDKFALEIYKGEQLVSLKNQGRGFRKIFDFVFSLAQQLDSLPKGSIVLIDDIETYLGVSAQRELRKFLKELGQKRDILFIVSTHSPFMIDCNHLDEVRILKVKDNGLGTEILDDEADKQSIIDEIAKIVGVNYGSVVSTNKSSNGE